MRVLTKLILLFLYFSTNLEGQNIKSDKLSEEELTMTFPSIYFKHNSTDYAVMPYSVDSCFKYIKTKIKDLNSFAVWRDSSEKERLTYIRIRKLKSDLNKYLPTNKIHFQSMGAAQKNSRSTIEKSVDNKQAQYLLSLNSVLDVSGAINNQKNTSIEKKQRKRLPRLVWCGWKYGFHWSSTGKINKKTKTK
ncbi:MAG: hypothetical protein ABIP51_21880 [Bacteroidia bacterium]